MDIELSDKGRQRAIEIMEMIEQIRADHHACTAREVSRLLCTTHTIVFGRLQRLREFGLVAWTDLTGSLHLTPAGGEWLASQRGEVRAVRQPVKKAPAKKAAAKKAAATKK